MNRQFEKIVVAILVSIFATTTIAMPVKAETKQVFRLLAVENNSSGYLMKSGQYLISNLLNFSNWNNSTDGYVSYIHLLSLFNYSDLFENCKKYYAGNATKANMSNEIRNFLGVANPGEVVVLYYCGEGLQKGISLDEPVDETELDTWLKTGELPQTNLCLIFDSCFSGSMIKDGLDGLLGSGRIVLCSSLSNQSSWSWGISAWTWFTGQEKTAYVLHGPRIPLGVIGGLYAANDTNGNGFTDMMECFEFAGPSTTEYSSLQKHEQDPVAYNGIGHDIPFVLRTPSKPPVANFTFTPPNPTVNQSITFNATGSNGNVTTYSWNFGDGNKTSITQPLISHTYTQPNGYTVTLNVTDINGLWNTTSSIVSVTSLPPINHDIAVINVSSYRAIVGNKSMTSVNVTLENQGNTEETFNVTLHANTTLIGTQTITLNNTSTVTIHWNTTGLALGNYTLTAYAEPVPGETDTTDNSLSSTIQVSILGDINGDGRVDMKDVSRVAAGFQTHPNQPKWVANGDLDENGVIDMKDISTISKQFGMTS